jgi:hypothetical protein
MSPILLAWLDGLSNSNKHTYSLRCGCALVLMCRMPIMGPKTLLEEMLQENGLHIRATI